jgi:hypothetical protein
MVIGFNTVDEPFDSIFHPPKNALLLGYVCSKHASGMLVPRGSYD